MNGWFLWFSCRDDIQSSHGSSGDGWNSKNSGYPKMDAENNGNLYEPNGWFGRKTHYFRKHPYNPSNLFSSQWYLSGLDLTELGKVAGTGRCDRVAGRWKNLKGSPAVVSIVKKQGFSWIFGMVGANLFLVFIYSLYYGRYTERIDSPLTGAGFCCVSTVTLFFPAILVGICFFPHFFWCSKCLKDLPEVYNSWWVV